MNDTARLVAVLPAALQERPGDLLDELVEVVLDLGRPPIARLTSRAVTLGEDAVTQADIDAAVARAVAPGLKYASGEDRPGPPRGCPAGRAPGAPRRSARRARRGGPRSRPPADRPAHLASRDARRGRGHPGRHRRGGRPRRRLRARQP